MNNIIEVWPLNAEDNTCPYCHRPLQIMRKTEGMYIMKCEICNEYFKTQSQVFDNFQLRKIPRSKKLQER